MKKFKLQFSWQHVAVLLIAASSAFSSFGQEKEGIYLRLWHPNAVEPFVEFSMDKDPMVVFDEDVMRLSTDLLEVYTYDMAEMGKFTYHDYTQTGVDDVRMGSVSFRFDGDCVFITAPVNGCELTVYNAGGMLVKQSRIAGSETVSLAELGRGVYFVNVNGQTYKIVKK